MCPSRLREGWCSGRSPAGCSAAIACSSRVRLAFDLVVQRQKPLPGQIEAVLGLELAVGDKDVDLFVEGEQLEHGEGVAFAVDGAEVVAGKRQLGTRRQQEVALTGVAGLQGGGEVGVGDRKADAHVAAVF